MHVCVHKIDRFCLNSLAHTHNWSFDFRRIFYEQSYLPKSANFCLPTNYHFAEANANADTDADADADNQ